MKLARLFALLAVAFALVARTPAQIVVYTKAEDVPASLVYPGNSTVTYYGFTEATGLTAANFLGRVTTPPANSPSVVGIDSTSTSSPRTVSENLTLPANTYLGTSTKVTLTGTLTPADTTMRLAALQGGTLTLAGAFASKATSALIGIAGNSGTVQITSANNSLQNVTLQAGTLLLGNSNAIGSGTLTLAASDLTLAAAGNVSLRNFITSTNSGTTLNLRQDTAGANLILNGSLNGTISTVKYSGAGLLTLNNSANYTELTVNASSGGGVVINSGSSFSHLTLNGGSATFTSPHASLTGGLDGVAGTQLNISSGANLTIYGVSTTGVSAETSGATSHMSNTYNGTIAGAGSLTLSFGSYNLSGNNTYTGGTTLDSFGTLAVGHNNALGTGPVVVGFSTSLSALSSSIALANAFKLQSFSDYTTGLTLTGDNSYSLTGIISGVGSLTKNSSNTVRLSGNNTFSGGVNIYQGTVEFASDTAAGTGPLTLNPYYRSDTVEEMPKAAAASSSGAVASFTSSSPLINGLIDTSSGFGDILPLVQLAANSTLTIHQNDASEYYGTIAGTNARVNKTGYGILSFGGTASYTGGTIVNGGGLVFLRGASLPASGLISVATDGYVGFSDTSTSVATFLSKFDKANTHGSIGFDLSTSGEAPYLNSVIDLTGFASDARLGTATHATIGSRSTLTPQGTTYRFGGGGGLLEIDMALTAAPNVVAESPNVAPLTVRFTGQGNTFSSVSATQSAIIFAPNTMPADVTLAFGTGGYIGTEDRTMDDNNKAMSAFISSFPTTGTGIVGFDSSPGTSLTREISANIDLSTRGALALGTTSRGFYNENLYIPGTRLTGTITPSANVYRFTGYKGGTLDVNSTLSNDGENVRSLVIGDSNSIATLGDPSSASREYSKVILSRANSFTGGTTFFGGELILGNAAALGTGPLNVRGTPLPSDITDPVFPMLAANLPDLTIANTVSLSTNLTLGGRNSFTLAGNISGTGGLYVEQDNGSYPISITLSGNNTFAGGIYLESGTLTLASNTAAGTGKLSIGFSGDSSSGAINFTSSAPVIGGLESDRPDVSLSLGAGTKLTINQTTDSTFQGTIYSSSSETGAQIIKTGSGTLTLQSNGSSLYGINNAGTRISADIQQGTVIVSSSSSSPLGASAVKVSGGTLIVDNTSLSNSLIVTSGRIAGYGSFGGSPTIGAGSTLAPGVSSNGSLIGQLSFSDLTLGSGGTYEWNIQGNGSSFTSDLITVTSADTLTINSTSAIPFTIKLVSLTGTGALGTLTGLQAGETYRWLLFGSNNIAGFSADKFVLDTTQFSTGSILGNLSLSQQTFTTGSFATGIMLNFTPVPEPSTWALLIGGLGVMGLLALRRRQR